MAATLPGRYPCEGRIGRQSRDQYGSIRINGSQWQWHFLAISCHFWSPGSGDLNLHKMQRNSFFKYVQILNASPTEPLLKSRLFLSAFVVCTWMGCWALRILCLSSIVKDSMRSFICFMLACLWWWCSVWSCLPTCLGGCQQRQRRAEMIQRILTSMLHKLKPHRQHNMLLVGPPPGTAPLLCQKPMDSTKADSAGIFRICILVR